MSTFFYDSNRTLKIREQLKEKINKVQNLNEAMNLLNEITTDFLNIYDSLASDTDHLQRVVDKYSKIDDRIDKLEKDKRLLYMDNAILQTKYNTALEMLQDKLKEKLQ